MIKQYRKKPVVIEAMLFEGNKDHPSMEEIQDWIAKSGTRVRNDRLNIYITTLEGEMRAEVGDYIIKGVKGEFYPCKPDIFAATYEEVPTSE